MSRAGRGGVDRSWWVGDGVDNRKEEMVDWTGRMIDDIEWWCRQWGRQRCISSGRILG